MMVVCGVPLRVWSVWFVSIVVFWSSSSIGSRLVHYDALSEQQLKYARLKTVCSIFTVC